MTTTTKQNEKVNEKFWTARRVAWVNANNLLKFGNVVKHSEEYGRIVVKDDDGYQSCIPVERIAVV